MTTIRITGVILSGGKATRMGGLDKGLVNFQKRPLIAHVIERFKHQVDELIINANREIDYYSSFGYPIVQDEIPGFAGPLAGLHAGMKAAKHPYVLIVPCDAPLLPLTLAERLVYPLIEENSDMAVAVHSGFPQPVFSIYKISLLPSLEAFLNEGGRKVDQWQSLHDAAKVCFNDSPDAFANLNTMKELTNLEDMA